MQCMQAVQAFMLVLSMWWTLGQCINWSGQGLDQDAVLVTASCLAILLDVCFLAVAGEPKDQYRCICSNRAVLAMGARECCGSYPPRGGRRAAAGHSVHADSEPLTTYGQIC